MALHRLRLLKKLERTEVAISHLFILRSACGLTSRRGIIRLFLGGGHPTWQSMLRAQADASTVPVLLGVCEQNRAVPGSRWGVGGHKTQMFVEDDGGAVGAWHELGDIEELDRQLDTRGIREHGLKAGLQKAWPSIQRALTQSNAGHVLPPPKTKALCLCWRQSPLAVHSRTL